ncbi:unnamed protein product [Cuscuta epithymum]|uniref:RRM domain-containing protein n=1 Tax=Cuscuta epithymum TaxID=186058 RepID=A0AAV0F0F1_9ASTE|nr:unnamed protein product [Cuscuta epithymum]
MHSGGSFFSQFSADGLGKVILFLWERKMYAAVIATLGTVAAVARLAEQFGYLYKGTQADPETTKVDPAADKLSAHIRFLLSGIPRFNGNGYEKWRTLMKFMLKTLHLWDLVERGYTGEELMVDALQDVQQKDALALLLIHKKIHESVSPCIDNVKTSKEAWDALQKKYEGNAAVTKSNQANVKAVETKRTSEDFTDFNNKLFSNGQCSSDSSGGCRVDSKTSTSHSNLRPSEDGTGKELEDLDKDKCGSIKNFGENSPHSHPGGINGGRPDNYQEGRGGGEGEFHGDGISGSGGRGGVDSERFKNNQRGHGGEGSEHFNNYQGGREGEIPGGVDSGTNKNNQGFHGDRGRGGGVRGGGFLRGGVREGGYHRGGVHGGGGRGGADGETLKNNNRGHGCGGRGGGGRGGRGRGGRGRGGRGRGGLGGGYWGGSGREAAGHGPKECKPVNNHGGSGGIKHECFNNKGSNEGIDAECFSAKNDYGGVDGRLVNENHGGHAILEDGCFNNQHSQFGDCNRNTSKSESLYSSKNETEPTEALGALGRGHQTNTKDLNDMENVDMNQSHVDLTEKKSGHISICIQNLDKGISNDALHDVFSAFGKILSCKVVTDGSGVSMGHGYIEYGNVEAAQKAVEMMNGARLEHKNVQVKSCPTKQEKKKHSPTNVFVGNLSESTSEGDLRNAFHWFGGTISSVIIVRDRDGISKGYGFVHFRDADDAAWAVEVLNGHKFDDKVWQVRKAYENKFVGKANKKKSEGESAQSSSANNSGIKSNKKLHKFGRSTKANSSTSKEEAGNAVRSELRAIGIRVIIYIDNKGVGHFTFEGP